MTFAPRTLGCALAFAALATAAAPAHADEAAAAQALFDQAKKAMAAHDYAAACPKFEESFRLQEAVGTLLNLALCYEQQGRLASAWSKFLEVAAKARDAGQAERARIAREHAAALAPKLSNLVVDVPAASRVTGLEVRRDGTVLGPVEWGTPIPADAGQHTVDASAPGRKPWSRVVVVGDGASTARLAVPVLETLASEPARPPPVAGVHAAEPLAAEPPTPSGDPGKGMRIAAVVAAGVGVAGIGVGTVFGLLSLVKHNDANSACPSSGCPTETGVDLWRQAYDFGTVSTVGFIAGGVGLATGAVLWFVAPKGSEPTAAPRGVELALGLGHASVRGTW